MIHINRDERAEVIRLATGLKEAAERGDLELIEKIARRLNIVVFGYSDPE
jgi:hypothetical protein